MSIKSAKPAGHRVLVKPDELEKVTSGGIVLPETDKERKQSAQICGTIVDVGPQAWKDFSDGTPWAQKGDRVLFAKYGGYEIEIDGAKHRIMNDEDVTAIIQEG